MNRLKKFSGIVLILLISIFYAAYVNGALVTIPDKGVGDQLTNAEFNQILDAIKDGTKEINCSGLQVAGNAMVTTILELNKLNNANVSSADFIALGNMPDSGNIVSDIGVDTLQNKLFDGDDNTFQDLAVGVLKGVVADSADLNYAKSLYDTGVSDSEYDKLDGLTPTTTQMNILADDGAKGNALLGRSAGGAIGNIQSIDGNPNISSPLTFLNMPFWVKKTINYDDTSPVTIFAVDDGYVAHAAIVAVTTAWDDGSKAFKVGYTADDDGFITDLGAALETPKYYGIEDTYWGARIYDAVDKHQKLYVFSGSTNIIATFVGEGNAGSQGVCDVYVLVSRLN